MPIVGTNLGASVAGASSAERAQIVRKSEKPAPARGKARAPEADELIVGAEGVEPSEAVRRLASNEQEESHDDRQRGYDAHGRAEHGAPAPHIDIAG
ncbi:MAG: hypothetical protein DYG92_10610 [Leptolyngbya sp. PLA1]|nr:hypothetical protein [Leptolyngbya sp. PLA1]